MGDEHGVIVCDALVPNDVGSIEQVSTGRFEAAGSSGEVRTNAETARTFDETAVIARVREGRWAV